MPATYHTESKPRASGKGKVSPLCNAHRHVGPHRMSAENDGFFTLGRNMVRCTACIEALCGTRRCCRTSVVCSGLKNLHEGFIEAQEHRRAGIDRYTGMDSGSMPVQKPAR